MADTAGDQPTTTRRTILAGVGVVGVVGSLAACNTASPNDTAGTGAAPSAPAEDDTAAGDAGSTGLAKVDEIPVGSGKIFDNVVVTQPKAGTFKAFSTVCTHQGCQVNAIAGGVIKCPCHGSQFSIADGSVKAGPAPAPLPAKAVTVKDGEISVT
jgi:Rieske Fe-S protein